MGVELRPRSVACNLACTYCYQEPQRAAGNVPTRYDLEVMKAAVLREGGPFTLFGGEPLLMPLRDLEALFAWGLERFGQNSIQTNGALIGEEHIALFREYQVQVGVSIDGPGALNDGRFVTNIPRTRAATLRTEAAIARLCAEGLPPSLIVTLHRLNATPEHLPAMIAWFRALDALGVREVRLHLLEVEDATVRAQLALGVEENLAALRAFERLEPTLQLRFDLFGELERMLVADDRHATCVWRSCDPYTTEAVRGVEGDGRASNCGRTAKLGIDFVKSAAPGYERSLILYQVPQEHGGCAGCRFFLVCRGQCPGTAIDGDWRNRSELCGVWKGLFRDAEARLLDRGEFPISAQPNRVYLERVMLAAWAEGRNPTLGDAIAGMQASGADHGSA